MDLTYSDFAEFDPTFEFPDVIKSLMREITSLITAGNHIGVLGYHKIYQRGNEYIFTLRRLTIANEVDIVEQTREDLRDITVITIPEHVERFYVTAIAVHAVDVEIEPENHKFTAITLTGNLIDVTGLKNKSARSHNNSVLLC